MTYPIQFKNPPSPQQRDIFDAVLHGKGSVVVQATAGAGKSTTLVNLCALMAATGTPLGDVLFVAFNKAIVTELQEKLPTGVHACTMHSFGMSILRDHLDTLKVDNFKYPNLIRDLLAEEGLKRGHSDLRVVTDSAKQLANDVRLNTLDFSDRELLLQALEDTQPDFPKAYAWVITGAVSQALTKGVKLAQRRGDIDFTDMLWLPFVLGLTPKIRYATVMVDEAQDLNELQHWLVSLAKRPGGRLVIVGDKHQAIYGFTGAAPDSMGILGRSVGAEEFPLSVTWRCPSSHVELAQAIVGEGSIQAPPSAARGEVGELSHAQFKAKVQPGDVVLGRTNRPLIAQAFEFIRDGRRAKIRGRDIGQGLIRTVESIHKEYGGRAFDLDAFISSLDEYHGDKVDAIYKRTDLTDDQISSRVAEQCDRTEVLRTIAENSAAKMLDDLKGTITDLFDDAVGNFILLSTIHKAKGLEFDNVFLIDAGNVPAPFAVRTPEGEAGEACVVFVALTRAKKGLHFVGGVPNYPALRAVLARQNPAAVA